MGRQGMDARDMALYYIAASQQLGEEYHRFCQWWTALPPEQPITKAELQPLVEAVERSLLIQQNSNTAAASHLDWRVSSVSALVRDRLLGALLRWRR